MDRRALDREREKIAEVADIAQIVLAVERREVGHAELFTMVKEEAEVSEDVTLGRFNDAMSFACSPEMGSRQVRTIRTGVPVPGSKKPEGAYGMQLTENTYSAGVIE